MQLSTDIAEGAGLALYPVPHMHSVEYSVPANLYPWLEQREIQLAGVLVVVSLFTTALARTRCAVSDEQAKSVLHPSGIGAGTTGGGGGGGGGGAAVDDALQCVPSPHSEVYP